MIGRTGKTSGGAEPWKTDGRKWHLSQKSLPTGRRKQWTPATLVELAGRIAKAVPKAQLDWNHKTSVRLRLGDGQGELGRLITNSRDGIKVEFRCPRGVLTPARIDGLGADPQIVTGPGEHDLLRFFVRDPGDLNSKQLKVALRHCESASATEN